MPELTKKGAHFHDGGLLWGATNSGKTYPVACHFGRYVAENPGKHLLIGSNLKLLRNEVIPLIRAVARSYRCKTTPYRTDTGTFRIHKSIIVVVAGMYENAVERLRTHHNALSLMAEEVAAQDERFFDVAVSRMSMPLGPIWATCNPASPINWVKQRIDEHRWDKEECFYVRDNPSLTPEQVDAFEAQFAGLFKKRMIDALWVAGEGLIYPNWADLSRLDPDDEVDQPLMNLKTVGPLYIGADYGEHNVTYALICQRAESGQWVIKDEYVHNAAKSGVHKDAKHHATDIKTVVSKHRAPVAMSYLDPSATDLKRAFDDVGLPQQNAYNKDDGYSITDGMLQRRELVIDGKACPYLVSNQYGLIWNKYGDKPDPNCVDHGTDSERYLACGLYEGRQASYGGRRYR